MGREPGSPEPLWWDRVCPPSDARACTLTALPLLSEGLKSCSHSPSLAPEDSMHLCNRCALARVH